MKRYEVSWWTWGDGTVERYRRLKYWYGLWTWGDGTVEIYYRGRPGMGRR